MKLYSTRNLNEIKNPKDAIIKGLSDDGGLYCPKFEDIVAHKFDIKNLLSNDYKATAKLVFKIFFDDFTDAEIDNCINLAYNKNNFDVDSRRGEHCEPAFNIAPVTKIGDNYLMELYHGPTSAFKDVALTILPQFLTTAYKSKGQNKKVYILTATSGDTGKAALSGFKDVENTIITVFYPTDGVSNIQKLQMQTSEGKNVSVVALKGDFDDCQRLVKEIYTDNEIKKLCEENNVVLSSANSINIGRLVPQIVYYIQTYIDLVNANNIKIGDKINFVVPTGNFGDILAGFIAKLLGTPIDKLICASNDNNVLTDFINTGIYNEKRELYKTISPSMDILVSSNLERLLFLLSGNDADFVNGLMGSLNKTGEYKIEDNLLNKIKEHFVAYYATQDECKKTIKDAFENEKRIIDTHTAVAYACLKKYLTSSIGSNACGAICRGEHCEPSVVLSTASPYKFARDVLKCICDSDVDAIDDFECLDKLNELTKEPIPKNLAALKTKEKRFGTTLAYEECKNFVINNIEK
ncbi:MAG: threonine synthase [Lachnospiraceae bacterium]|nr:threonine synthase [Lachnospiraceae bacterium]